MPDGHSKAQCRCCARTMNVQRTPRHVGRCFWLDTNRINAYSRLPNVNQLERWAQNDVIDLEMCEVSQQEAMAGGNATRSQKALSHLAWSVTGDSALAHQIENILFPSGACSENEKNDVRIVKMARLSCAILVTADGASKTQPGGILGNRHALSDLGVQVMTDEEAVAHVRERIAVRDGNAKYEAEKCGLPLPEWVGRD